MPAQPSNPPPASPRFAPGRSRGAGLALAAALLAFAAFACGGDDKPKEPEFIRAEPSFGERVGGPAPEILRSAPGGGAQLTPGGPPTTASAGALESDVGLTVQHTEAATLRADSAILVALLQSRPPGPLPIAQIPLKDQNDVLAALAALGVKREDVTFQTNPTFGPFPAINVRMPLDNLPQAGKRVIDAIETVVGRTQSGVRFTISDCATALAPLRKAAFEAAAQEARSLADAASLTLGPILSISLASQPGYGPPSDDPCDPDSLPFPKGPSSLRPLDAQPEARVSLNLAVTYSVGGPTSSARLAASGAGKAVAKADEAYVVASIPVVGGPFGPLPINERDRKDLIAKIKALGVDEDDIELTDGAPYGQSLLSVEMSVEKAARDAEKVIAAVEDVFGRTEVQGVWFSHSNCLAVLTEARKQAIADARAQAESLAAAAGLKLGGLAGVSEPPGVPGYGIGLTPCTEDLATLINVGGPYAIGLKPLGAEPEFTVTAAVTVAYELTGP